MEKQNVNLGLSDDRLHCPECGDIVFKKLPGTTDIECMNCGHKMPELTKLTHA
ncbi:hypothetical protein [Levilactobacillus brevis]|uniref:Uncharacterized protein n=2 Tax=Levilactobacillus brevis TaxID=1580 RepID=U2PMD7_LEVBR|nr:hypothetical protein [Levilactobacillus brevis]ERK44919.1 hypothetical protein HMPREF0495_00586 [Levilactobacillus brevis ATCC 14869 = DSM 20054]KID43630.1 hypothetical protein LbDm2_1797 [Levilactobacillus brevis]KIO98927.1 hypothetical protein QP38_1616 [Levilactobacillus brevis]KRK20571.1 hypothetical protein FC61_GL001355 [Levilactobacillus brevis ATCC 14869 = DSM 20054]MBS0947334.1 hypothetical protein [Levilactobacillus brevis]